MKKIKKFLKGLKVFFKVFCPIVAILSFFGCIFVLLQFDEQNIKIAEYLGLPAYQKYEVAKLAFEKAEEQKNISVDSRFRYSSKHETIRCRFLSSKSDINREILMICAMICIVAFILSCVLCWESILSFYYDE